MMLGSFLEGPIGHPSCGAATLVLGKLPCACWCHHVLQLLRHKRFNFDENQIRKPKKLEVLPVVKKGKKFLLLTLSAVSANRWVIVC